LSKAAGYFEALTNQHASRLGSDERALAAALTQAAREVLPRCQIRWAGSQIKGTAIQGSDLDLCLENRAPVNTAERRKLRAAFERAVARPCVIRSHVVRLQEHKGAAKVDVAFANAAFGSRPLPDTAPFKAFPARRQCVRALKLWSRNPGFPPFPGWVTEALTLHLDQAGQELSGLALFQRTMAWLSESATPAAVEGVLRPHAAPSWNPNWSKRLPGRLQALGDKARGQLVRSPAPATWSSAEQAAQWLGLSQ
jgi:hypothetical protein